MGETAQWEIQAESEGKLSIYGGGVSQRRSYSASKEGLSANFGCEIPPILEDLVDLAVIIHVADRTVRRRQQRHFAVRIAVRDAERWNCPQVGGHLSRVLDFLTEDRWEFTFQPRVASKVRPIQRILVPERPVVTALFSGGLDSVAGLATYLAKGGGEALSVVTCASNSRLLRKQRDLLREFHRRSKARLLPVIFPIRLHQKRREYNLNERSQRGRAFLFFALGAATSIMAGSNELLIFENGIGAINLPVSDAQLGVDSSRATHPVALLKFELFLSQLLGVDFRLRLPFLFETKAELVSRLRETPFRDLASRSISCDGFPLRVTGAEQCGVCTSCLLRREALWTAGLREDHHCDRYRYDVLGDIEAIPGSKLAPLWDMLTQAERIGAAAESPRPWKNLVSEYPEVLEVCETVGERRCAEENIKVSERLVALYRNYAREWQCFPVRPPGWGVINPIEQRLCA